MQSKTMGIMMAAGLTLTSSWSLEFTNCFSSTSSFSYSGSSGSGSGSGSGVVSPSFFLQEKLSPKSALNWLTQAVSYPMMPSPLSYPLASSIRPLNPKNILSSGPKMT